MWTEHRFAMARQNAALTIRRLLHLPDKNQDTTPRFIDGVITAFVAVIHRGASVIYQQNSTPVEPWITGTSPVMTILRGAEAFFSIRNRRQVSGQGPCIAFANM